MKRYYDAKCAARINGIPCGLTPAFHAVERRWTTSSVPIGHGFVFAQGATPQNSQTE